MLHKVAIFQRWIRTYLNDRNLMGRVDGKGTVRGTPSD